MEKLEAMETFVAIIDEGSLTGAARALGKAQTTVVRSLAVLEEELGVRLLQRTTRRRSLTAEGHTYLAHCRQILADVREAEAMLRRDITELRGTLRVTAPVTFGQLRVAPIIHRFLAAHPQVRVELVLLDRVVDLVEEGFDLGVRIAQLRDSGLIAIKVGEVRPVVVASPNLLCARGVPRHPSELQDYPAVTVSRPEQPKFFRFSDPDGPGVESSLKVPITSVFSTNLVTSGVEACVAGLGVGRFLSYQVQSQIDAGTLRRILCRYEPPAISVHVIHAHARLVSARQRRLVEWLRAELTEERRECYLDQQG